jgi:4-amino-4-deoxy-L-arabinose transferase-like glycosyltransferase
LRPPEVLERQLYRCATAASPAREVYALNQHMTVSAPTPVARPALAILAIGVALVAGLRTPWFVDYDEAAYAEVAHHMWVSGDWLRPVANCEPFLEKPTTFFWLVALLYKIVGLTPLAPRLVSASALMLGLAFLAREVRRHATPEAAEVAAWVAGGALLPFTLGRVGIFDALLTAAITVALLSFLRGLGEEDPHHTRRALVLGYAATGVALAVKGPAFPLLVAAVLLSDALVRREVRRTLQRSGIVWGAPLVLAVGLPPYALTAHAAGTAFLTDFLGEHNLGRFLTPMQGHHGSALYYLAILAVGLLPFSAFLPGALLRARSPVPRSRRLGSFATVWGVLVLVAFSLAATKLPNYIAPAVPAFAIVIGLALGGEAPRAGIGWHVTLALCIGFSVLIAALPALLTRLPVLLGQDILRSAPELAHLPLGPWPRLGFFISAGLLAVGSTSAWLLARRAQRLLAVRTLGLAGTVAWVLLLTSVGGLIDATANAPVRSLAAMAARGLAPGVPIYAVEMNNRVTVSLASGRCTVFLRTRTPAERDRVREVLARDGSVRMIMPDIWWDELRPTTGGHELARDGAYVLVTSRD